MLGNSQNFTEEQIRALIFALNLIGEKNSGYIPINSLNDASELVAYVSGYESWKQLRVALRKEQKSIEDYNYIEHPKHISNHTNVESAKDLIIDLNIEKLSDIEKQLKLPKIKFKHDTVEKVVDIEQMATGHLIVGSFFDTQLKYEKIFHLNPQNTLCISNNPSFFDNVCLQAYKIQKHIIDFSHIHHQLAQSQGLEFIKLDPLNEVYSSEHLDKILQLDFDNHNGFDLLFSLLVKDHCQSNNYIINTNILKRFTSLEFLTIYSLTLKKNKSPLSSLLDKYLISLKIKKDQKSIIYLKENVLEHLSNVEKLYLNILHLEELYNNGTFSYQSHQLFNNFVEHKSICVYAPLNIDDYTSFVYSQTLDYCCSQFDTICESKNYTHIHYNTLILNSNPLVFKLKSLYTKNYSYHLRLSNKFENDILNLFQQIVFGQLNSIESPNKEWLIKFFLFTPDTINIFALGNEILRTCDEKTAFLWRTKEVHPILSQDSFEIDEIKIYSPETKIQK